MANYIIIEDREEQWEEYNSFLSEHLERIRKFNENEMLGNLKPHKANNFYELFKQNKDNLKSALESKQLDLIICDNSLGGRHNNHDSSKWAVAMLKQIVEESDEAAAVLRQRGVALLIVTQHYQENLNTLLRDHKHWLDDWFPNWEYLSQEDFDGHIIKALNSISYRFIDIDGTGRWYHESNVQRVFGPRTLEFQLQDIDLILTFNQIIAVELNGDSQRVFYTPKPDYWPEKNDVPEIITVLAKRDNLTKLGFFDSFSAIDLGGRDTELPENFNPKAAFFLHVRGRNPNMIINTNFFWRYQNANHGKKLLLFGRDSENNGVIIRTTSFPALGDYIKYKFNIRNGEYDENLVVKFT